MLHAIILAAECGNHSAARDAEDIPNCLLEVGGRSLLAHHLDLLFKLGVPTADIVVGYRASLVIEHVATLDSRPDVAWHFNPRYELGSVLSLKAAEETLESGSDVLVMDADVLYHPDILKRLVESEAENCFLLDRDVEGDDQAARIALHEGRIVDFRHALPEGLEYDGIGTSVGFYKFGQRAAQCINEECARFEAEGLSDAPHEEALRNVLLSCPLAFGYEDISGLPWIKVGSAEDTMRVGERILRANQAADER